MRARYFESGLASITNYEDVPWYRRSGTASVLVLGGFFCFPPLLWTACILCLTGEIYSKSVGSDGTLTTWPRGNKIAAVIILVLQSIGIVVRLSGLAD